MDVRVSAFPGETSWQHGHPRIVREQSQPGRNRRGPPGRFVSYRALRNSKYGGKRSCRFMTALAQEVQNRTSSFLRPHPFSPPTLLCCLGV